MRLPSGILARPLPAPGSVAILAARRTRMLKVGIVGMGVIGTHIARAIDEGIPGVALAGVTVRSPAKAAGFKALPLESLIHESDLVVEAATQAAKAFPANVNVVAAVSLASVGPEKTRIKIFAVPGQLRNQHRVTVEGEFGRLVVEVENVPSENPRTGKLSYLSAIAMLRELGSSVQIGN